MKLDFSSIDNDLIIQNGDFVVENSELQQAQAIIQAAPGEFKQFPLVGVGIEQFIGSTIDKPILYAFITNALAEDELYVDSISVDITDKTITFDIELK